MKTVHVRDILGYCLVVNGQVEAEHVDVFGHLNFGELQKLIVRKRIQAIFEKLGMTIETMKKDGVMYVIGEQFTKMHRPAFLSWDLLFLSWTYALKSKCQLASCLVLGRKDSIQNWSLLASSNFSICSVDLEGCTMQTPEHFTTINDRLPELVKDSNFNISQMIDGYDISLTQIEKSLVPKHLEVFK